MKLSPQQLYVKNLAVAAMHDSLTASGGNAVIAGLDSSTTRALAVQINDPNFKARQDSERARLRHQLGITGDDWSPSSEAYQARSRRLRRCALRRPAILSLG